MIELKMNMFTRSDKLFLSKMKDEPEFKISFKLIIIKAWSKILKFYMNSLLKSIKPLFNSGLSFAKRSQLSLSFIPKYQFTTNQKLP